MKINLQENSLADRIKKIATAIIKRAHMRYKKKIKIWRRLPLRSQLYRSALIGTLALLIIAITFPKQELLNNTILTISVILYAAGFLTELSTWLSTAHSWSEKNIIAKGAIAGLLAMAATICATHASSIVNKISKSSENPLPYTTTLLTVPSTFFIIIFGLSLTFFAIFIHTNLVNIKSLIFDFTPNIYKNRSKYLKKRRLGRRASLSLIRLTAGGVAISQALIYSGDYDKLLEFGARFFAFHFEMVENDPCATENERIARINDDIVLVGTPLMWDARFHKKICSQDTGITQ